MGARFAVVVAATLLGAAAQLAAQTAIVVEDWRDAAGAAALPQGGRSTGASPS